MSSNPLNSSMSLLSNGTNMNQDLAHLSQTETQEIKNNLLNNEFSNHMTNSNNVLNDGDEKKAAEDSKTSLNSSVTREIPLVGTCYLKLLVSNVMAGAVIGPKGSTVLHISTTTNCNIKLSNSTCLYPGTNERIVVISGKLENLQKAFLMIVERIQSCQIGSSPNNHNNNKDVHHTMDNSNFSPNTRMNDGQPRGAPRISIKIVVPNSAVSQIIGKEGIAVKDLQARTNTRIQISNRDERQIKERIVHIMGAVDDATKASFHIIESIQSDPHIKHHIKLDYTNHEQNVPIQNNALNYFLSGLPIMAGGGLNPLTPDVNTMFSSQAASGVQGIFRDRALGVSPRPLGNPGFYSQGLPHNKNLIPMLNTTPVEFFDSGLWNPDTSGPIVEYTFEIPNSCVGHLIGRNGTALQNIQQQAGVKIRISGKGEFVRGTENRRLTISGNAIRIQCAAVLLQHRLQSLDMTSRPPFSDTMRETTFDTSSPQILNTSSRRGSSEHSFNHATSRVMLKGGSLTPHQYQTSYADVRHSSQGK